MNEVALRNLSKFFLTVGNGETLETLRGLVEEVEKGVPLEKIFQKVVAQARIEAASEKDHFKCLHDWAVIAGYTHEDSDLMMAEDYLLKIQAPNQRGAAKKMLVKAFAKAGHVGDARTLAGNIRSHYWRGEAYLEVYGISHDPADIKKAIDAAGAIISSDPKEEVLAKIRAAQHKK